MHAHSSHIGPIPGLASGHDNRWQPRNINGLARVSGGVSGFDGCGRFVLGPMPGTGPLCLDLGHPGFKIEGLKAAAASQVRAAVGLPEAQHQLAAASSAGPLSGPIGRLGPLGSHNGSVSVPYRADPAKNRPKSATYLVISMA